MKRDRGDLLRILLAALALSVPGTVLAAQAAKTKPAESLPRAPSAQDLELGEVLVEGSKPIRKKPQVIDWLKRFPGRFIVDGTVELHGEGESRNSQQVQGRVDCETFNEHPEVLCSLRIRWPDMLGPNGEALPGGVTTLNQAQMAFVFDEDRIGIHYMLVDSNGIAEDALGYLLAGDTLVARRKCVNMPGNCERVMRITAKPDLKEVVMKIGMEVEFRKTASFTFVMHRVGAPVADDPRAKK